MSNPSKKILIVAAEDSSCLYAERLIELWQKQGKDYSCFGIGSQRMEDLGFNRIGKSEELAVMGLQEVVKHWSIIKKTFLSIVDICEQDPPDLVLLLDYPGFNLRLAKKLKKQGLKIAYYISPQVWAWKKGRVKLIKKVVDKMFVLFPFEKDFYKKHNYEVEFLGHPLLDEIDPKFKDVEYTQNCRLRHGINKNEKVIALMPGSRKAEIEHHLNVQIQVAEELYKKDNSLRFLLFTAPGLSKSYLRDNLPRLNIPLNIIKDEPFAMIHLADTVLAASGTATLFVGLLKKPMVVMYIMKPVTAFLARLIVRSTPFFGIVNLIFNKQVSRELFQEQANVVSLTAEMEKIIYDTPERQQQVEQLELLPQQLGNSGVTERVAQSLDGLLNI